ncbi:MAG TPA: DUF1598 domain-containing protein [Planctomycetaceae bacterium]|nr:DUF1598 domain-containing protein [Planctomycetaceae bacterium]
MKGETSCSRQIWMLGVGLCCALLAQPVQAQFGGFAGGGGGFGGRGGIGGGGRGGGGTRVAGGILVDANGVVQPVFGQDHNAKLERTRIEADAREHLPSDLNALSPLRKISLRRLEEECAKYADRKQDVTVEMQFLAGLQRIDYVFIYPDAHDVVIAGPAEGFAFDAVGRAVGVSTGQPPIRLGDLLVALRCLERDGKFGCSIDPRQEALEKLGQWLKQQPIATSTDQAKSRFEQSAEIVGMQDVKVWGVPAESHFAQVLVEADYRMKRIGLGLDHPPVKGLHSHLATLGAHGNSMQRWWFVPQYDDFVRTEDGLGYQPAGPRAQVLAQEELVDQQGRRSDAGNTRQSTQKWARHFSKKFPELADRVPVFAEMRNLFDLAIVAALFKKEQIPQRAGWRPGLFLDAARAPTKRGPVPRQVPTCSNCKNASDGSVIGLVAGGVVADATEALQSAQFEQDKDATVARERTSARREQLPAAHAWWWD